MNVNWKWAGALSVIMVAAGCGKKAEDAAPMDAPAAVSSTAPVVAPAPAAPAEPSGVDDDKAAAIQAALEEDAIVSDSRGQWAVSATASSTYASDKDPAAKTSYAPMTATGAPDVERYGDNGNAWTTQTPDKGIEWLEVGFAQPVNATQIRIRQSFKPGAIIKVELIADDGSKHAIWQGVDAQEYAPSTIAWFDRTFDKTSYKVAGARITLATNAVSGWNEIDAVQLLGE